MLLMPEILQQSFARTDIDMQPAALPGGEIGQPLLDNQAEYAGLRELCAISLRQARNNRLDGD